MYAHMELIFFFLVVDLLPLGLFLWLFRHLPQKEQLAALSPLLLQLAVLLVCGIFDGESLLFAFGFGLFIPYLFLNAITLSGAFSAALCYRRQCTSNAMVLICCNFFFLLMGTALLMQ